MSDYGAAGAWLLLAVVVVVAVLIGQGSVWVGNRLLPADAGTTYNSALSPFLTVIGLVFGALLGFTVVVGWQEFLSAQVNVSNEASALTTMYRQTVAMPQPEQSQLREQLRRYAGAVQGPEWGKQDFGLISNTGRAAITDMYRIVGRQPAGTASSAINGDFLGRLTALASARSTRILDAKPRIPPLLWCSLIFGGSVVITLTGLLRLTTKYGHRLLTCAVSILLALLLYLVFELDHPFGPLGVTPQPFAHAVTVFDAVDSGT